MACHAIAFATSFALPKKSSDSVGGTGEPTNLGLGSGFAWIFGVDAGVRKTPELVSADKVRLQVSVGHVNVPRGQIS